MGPLREVTVLVVDDDLDIREVLMEILADSGYTSVAAADGREALALLTEVRPHLILLDLNMPIMNGRQFREAQRADPELRLIPTVIMTAVDRLTVQVADLGADGALPKPVRLHELLSLVARYSGSATAAAAR